MQSTNFSTGNKVDNYIHFAEKILLLYGFCVIFPGFIYFSENYLLTVIFCLLTLFQSIYKFFLQPSPPSPPSLLVNIFPCNKFYFLNYYPLTNNISLKKKVVGSLPNTYTLISSLISHPIRLFLLKDPISDIAKYLILFPFLIFTNFLIFINWVDTLWIAILCQIYYFAISFFFVTFGYGDKVFLVYTTIFLDSISLSAYLRRLKVKDPLEEQSTHMSAIHHEIKTPIQVKSFPTFFWKFKLKNFEGNSWSC